MSISIVNTDKYCFVSGTSYEYNIFRSNISSTINLVDEHVRIIPKDEIYSKLFGIDDSELPNLTYIKLRSITCSPKSINEIDKYNPDIFISRVGDNNIDHIKSKPKIIILCDFINRYITFNGEKIQFQFNDLGDEFIRSVLIKENISIEQMKDRFDTTHYYTRIALDNIVKRLIIEFIMQYRDNPTLTAQPKKDNKVKLLEIIDGLQSQINELRNRISDM